MVVLYAECLVTHMADFMATSILMQFKPCDFQATTRPHPTERIPTNPDMSLVLCSCFSDEVLHGSIFLGSCYWVQTGF